MEAGTKHLGPEVSGDPGHDRCGVELGPDRSVALRAQTRGFGKFSVHGEAKRTDCYLVRWRRGHSRPRGEH